MYRIIFLHGFYASGSCVPALALRDALDGEADVLTPDLPLHPTEALSFIEGLCSERWPDLLVGNSNGSFLAQMLAPRLGIPALLGNPHFRMTDFLSPRIGRHQYKSLRGDGKQDFVIDEALIDEFGRLQEHQFDHCRPDFRDKVWGLFGEADTLAHFEPLFLDHYTHSYHFPGGHTPTADEVRRWYVPLVRQMLQLYAGQ